MRLVDFDEVSANDLLAVKQFTVIEGQYHRRPDIVVIVNGPPLGLIELKNAADEDETNWSAYKQLQTYKAKIPMLLHYNAVQAMGDDQLKVIAAELVTQVRKNVTIDWEHREGARARICVIVKRMLKKYGYPPDLQEAAVKMALEQAKLICAEVNAN